MAKNTKFLIYLIFVTRNGSMGNSGFVIHLMVCDTPHGCDTPPFLLLSFLNSYS